MWMRFARVWLAMWVDAAGPSDYRESQKKKMLMKGLPRVIPGQSTYIDTHR